MVYVSQLETTQLTNIDNDYFRKLLETGCTKVKKRELLLINEERKRLDLIPFTEEDIKDILRQLKNIILINNSPNL